ncbi:D-alanine--D-alanine ligase family protein [Actinomyces polynesiensis]|uniref:D-alanine--D-alanine ligase family protein n=1 Tax=Actinomyces polynesiensis TaxID=1325934 RepID=UPI0005B8C334|nr:D-alanine--D-alanine ligase [Actinomyces polynesiensis]
MSTSLRVLVIAGGLTHERDVSVRSGRRVANVLQHLGHVVRVSDLDSGLLPLVEEFGPDVIWPLVHGSVGEDGSLQALLESLGVPFVGSNSVQAMLASNKPTAKGLVAAAGFATPGWVSLPQSLFRQLGASEVLEVLEHDMEFPVVVKPTDGGSALGISRAEDSEDLRSAMVDAFAYGERVMIEQYVEGHDIAVSVVDLEDGPVALPPVEIVTDDGHYNYDARYTTDTTQYFVPARLEAELVGAVSAAAVDVHRVLGLRHLSRIDFIVRGSTIWFIDANVAPGMTDTSLFPQAAEADGSFADVCARLVAYAASGAGSVPVDDEGGSAVPLD